MILRFRYRPNSIREGQRIRIILEREATLQPVYAFPLHNLPVGYLVSIAGYLSRCEW